MKARGTDSDPERPGYRFPGGRRISSMERPHFSPAALLVSALAGGAALLASLLRSFRVVGATVAVGITLAGVLLAALVLLREWRRRSR